MMHISIPVGVYYIGLYVYPLATWWPVIGLKIPLKQILKIIPQFFLVIMAFSKADS
jgi:hypothetical protein